MLININKITQPEFRERDVNAIRLAAARYLFAAQRCCMKTPPVPASELSQAVEAALTAHHSTQSS